VICPPWEVTWQSASDDGSSLSRLAAGPLAARAQQASKIFRVGFVGLPGAEPKRPEAFRAGLRDLGYEEGRNVVIEFR
jgi:hypothetical protein